MLYLNNPATGYDGSGPIYNSFQAWNYPTGVSTGPYTYSITSGSLPPGLSLNSSTGAVTGTTTSSATFPYTAQVVDSLGNVATSSGQFVFCPTGMTIAESTPGNLANDDWTVLNDDGNTEEESYPFANPPVLNAMFPNSGNLFFYAMGSASPCTIELTISTTPGQTYTLSFYFQQDVNPFTFLVQWNSSTLLNINATSGGSNSAWAYYSFTVTGTGSDLLAFTNTDPVGYLALDDVVLVAASSPVYNLAAFTLAGAQPSSANNAA
jgi:hypothetical protein